jgi:hypothetical protein
MEVHPHILTPRKKWIHYFWEFLMLFLAVFCGFLAENLREHSVEHQREKQYVQSLVSEPLCNTSFRSIFPTFGLLGIEQLTSCMIFLITELIMKVIKSFTDIRHGALIPGSAAICLPVWTVRRKANRRKDRDMIL